MYVKQHFSQEMSPNWNHRKNRRKKDALMMITDETIDYVAKLAKLELSGEAKESAKKDLGNILDYIDTMNELDTTGIEPMSHVFPIKNVFREDIVANEEDRDNLLWNAPDKKDGCFIVPKTVE